MEYKIKVLYKKINCFFCWSNSFENSSINIFSENAKLSSGKIIPEIISEIIGQNINKDKIHSNSICKNCFQLFKDYDSFFVKLEKIKTELLENYNKTLNKILDIKKCSETKFKNSKIEDDNGFTCLENLNIQLLSPRSENIEMLPEQKSTNSTCVSIFETSPSKLNENCEIILESNLNKVQMISNEELNALPRLKPRIENKSNLKKITVTVKDNRYNLKKIEKLQVNSSINNKSTDTLKNSFKDAAALKESDSKLEEKQFEIFEINDDSLLEVDDENSLTEPFNFENLIKNGNSIVILNNQGKNEGSNKEIYENGDDKIILNLDANFVNHSQVYYDDETGIFSFSNGQHDKEEFVEINENGSYVCLICKNAVEDKNVDKIFSSDSNTMINHFKEHHSSFYLNICDICGESFNKMELFDDHLEQHLNNGLQCELCDKIFVDSLMFSIHKRKHLLKNKMFECETCGKVFTSKRILDEHINLHRGVRPYLCVICQKSYASKYTYKIHVKTHLNRLKFKCCQCEKTFFSQQNLAHHEKIHSGLKEFICDVCGKSFVSQHNLEVHNIVHSGQKPFSCQLCGKSFARKAEIYDHERTHTGERPYQCEVCGVTFSQRSNLQSHKRATHYDDKRYKCSNCMKSFKRRRLLNYHIKAVHTGERPFQCEICEATFVYPEHFKKHSRIHTGEKPYKCEVCGKAFNSRDNRNAHRYVHSDKKPYECIKCGSGFMRKPLLIAHMKMMGHENDTIVVNQPRLKMTSNSDSEKEMALNLDDASLSDNVVSFATINEVSQESIPVDDNAFVNGKIFITDFKNNLIAIQDSHGHLILPSALTNEQLFDASLNSPQDTKFIIDQQDISEITAEQLNENILKNIQHTISDNETNSIYTDFIEDSIKIEDNISQNSIENSVQFKTEKFKTERVKYQSYID